ncbi:hypothetical protein [Maridesulfovibrio bastinii]|uniref:hypothetical protein n=1 Tax=Maridesulfovibrio bastinii TaxID=47157 RepID=UPI0003F73B3F|nr:hypothetical protein [Maridesulfovibrio bastinii]
MKKFFFFGLMVNILAETLLYAGKYIQNFQSNVRISELVYIINPFSFYYLSLSCGEDKSTIAVSHIVVSIISIFYIFIIGLMFKSGRKYRVTILVGWILIAAYIFMGLWISKKI